MQVKDISVKVERLEEVRGGNGGPFVGQSIYNGPTIGISAAFGGDVGSTTSSESSVLAGHVNTQSATVRSVHEKARFIEVFGSKDVNIGGRRLSFPRKAW